MCGISGFVSLSGGPLPDPAAPLTVMNELQRHRGPDGRGVWLHARSFVGFAHRRLSIIDLAPANNR